MESPIGATVTLDIAALIAAVVWPAVLVILALTYREAIRDTAQAALRRGFKVGFPGGWSFELPGAREASIKWLSGKSEVDLRHPVSSADITDSTRAEFSAQLQDRTPAEYARVDLGYGQEWLTSRLYFMSIVLSRLRGLVAFVFLDSMESTSQHFVGWAELADVRWALANRFPRLERAFLEASCDLAANSNLVFSRGETLLAPSPSQSTTELGSQPSSDAPADLLARFLDHIQRPAPPSPEEAVEWVPVSTTAAGAIAAPSMYEYGQWLNAALLSDVLGRRLMTASIRENELLAKSEPEQARLIGRHEGCYVALTHDDTRFSRLVDREAVMGQLAFAMLRQQDAAMPEQ